MKSPGRLTGHRGSFSNFLTSLAPLLAAIGMFDGEVRAHVLMTPACNVTLWPLTFQLPQRLCTHCRVSAFVTICLGSAGRELVRKR